MKNISQFRFKRFAVWHHRSAMKVGVDGVLVACWTDAGKASTILDVGSGCGVIALILAQRQSQSRIYGIDIDLPSVEEAKENADASPWKDRIEFIHGSFPEGLSPALPEDAKFDLIVSNPPFFDSGVTDAKTRREKARHQGELSPSSLLEKSIGILRRGGQLAMIVPTEVSERLKREAFALGYHLSRECLVRGHEGAPFKRAMLQWRLGKEGGNTDEPEYSELTLETSPGNPTEEYRTLCKDFYLKF